MLPPQPASGTQELRRSRRRLTIAAAVGAVLLSAGCGNGGESSSTGEATFAASAAASMAPAVPPGADGADAKAEDASTGGGAAAPATGVPGVAPAGAAVAAASTRDIIRTAELGVQLSVARVAVQGAEGTGTSGADPNGGPDAAEEEANAKARAEAVGAAASTARAAATTAGGYVAGSEGRGESVSVTVRVPADAYERVLGQFAALGTVERRVESSQDVTAELVDVNSRVETMTASVARVRALLTEATEIGDVIAIESELAAREAELESWQQQQAALSGQVALSTITLGLSAVTEGEVGTTVVSEGGFTAGLADGWAALLGLLSGLGRLFGALLPFVPLFAVTGVVLWLGIRFARRRRARSAAAPAGAGGRAASGTAGPEPAKVGSVAGSAEPSA